MKCEAHRNFPVEIQNPDITTTRPLVGKIERGAGSVGRQPKPRVGSGGTDRSETDTFSVEPVKAAARIAIPTIGKDATIARQRKSSDSARLLVKHVGDDTYRIADENECSRVEALREERSVPSK